MAMDPLNTSALLVSYNTRELTLACLKSIACDPIEGQLEIIVVDNASRDGSADAIEREFPQAKLIRLSTNIGFARANNLAARHANGKYLLLLNPDTVVLPGAIWTLSAFAAAHREFGIYGGRTLFADGKLNAESCWAKPTPWSVACQALGLAALGRRCSFFNFEAMGGWKRNSTREVDIISGCFLLIRRNLWERLGGFDERFFMYGEDADLCLRARRFGAKCLVCPEATIIHYGGASERVRADKMARLFTAKRMLFQRHWTPYAAAFGVSMLHVWILTRLFAFGAASLVCKKYREQYQTWCKIWAARGDWARNRVAPSATCVARARVPAAQPSELE